jgi:chitinase
VPNPKDVITKGLGSIPDLQRDLLATKSDFILDIWEGGSRTDGPDSYSLPVFMVVQAVETMAQVKELGAQEKKEEEAEAERQKNIILLIVSVFLIFVPVVGEELAIAAGMTTLARTIAIVGEAGNAALGIYDSVKNPESAFVNVLGMMFGVGSIAKAARTGEGLGAVAKIRQGMSADTVASFGKIFKENDSKLASIGKFCRNR